jgi:predicted RNA-binding protein with RPS1 domain
VGDRVKFYVDRIFPKVALGHFSLYGNEYKGAVHVFEFSKLQGEFIWDLSTTVKIGDVFDATVQKFSTIHRNWDLSLDITKTK